MAIIDLTTATGEQDATNRISWNGSIVNCNGLQRKDNSWIYKTLPFAIDGDWKLEYRLNINPAGTNNALAFPPMLKSGTTPETINDTWSSNSEKYYFQINWRPDGTASLNIGNGAPQIELVPEGVYLYPRLSRTGTVFLLEIFNDAARTDLFGSTQYDWTWVTPLSHFQYVTSYDDGVNVNASYFTADQIVLETIGQTIDKTFSWKIRVANNDSGILDLKTAVGGSDTNLIDLRAGVASSQSIVVDLMSAIELDQSNTYDAKVNVALDSSGNYDIKAAVEDVLATPYDLKVWVESFDVTDRFSLKTQIKDVTDGQSDLKLSVAQDATADGDLKITVFNDDVGLFDATITIADAGEDYTDLKVAISEGNTTLYDLKLTTGSVIDKAFDLKVWVNDVDADIVDIKLQVFDETIIILKRSVDGFPSGAQVQYMLWDTDSDTNLQTWTTAGVKELAIGGGMSQYYVNFIITPDSPQMTIAWNVVGSNKYFASESITGTDLFSVQALAHLENETVLDELTAKHTVYHRDGSTKFREADVSEDSAGAVPYDANSTKIGRRTRLKKL